MSATENALEVLLPSSEFEHQALMITLPNDYKEPVSPQSLLFDLSQNTTLFTEVKNSLQGSNAPLNDEMEVQEASSSAPFSVIHGSKTLQKLETLHLITRCPRKKNKISTDPAFLTSNGMPPILKPSSKPDLYRDDSLAFLLSTENFRFKPQLTSVSMASTQCKFQ